MKAIITAVVVLMITMSVSAQKVVKQNIPTQTSRTDTTSKPPVYLLFGAKEDFVLLLKSIDKPESITRGEVTKLHDWVNHAQLLITQIPDTIKKAEPDNQYPKKEQINSKPKQ